MIEVNNLTKFRIQKTFFVEVAKKVLRGENRVKENVSIAFVSPTEIHQINKQYRKKDKPTDVLSFAKTSDFKEEYSEVIICPEYVKEHMEDSKLSFKNELAKMLIHGLLHNAGYDHETSEDDARIMFEKQDYYLSKII